METQSQFNPISFQKGKLFEEYVEKNIFPASNYVLVHKTHDYPQNSERYVESSLKPDFLFRCRISNQEFYVDAKYRTNLSTDAKFSVLKDDQLLRFKEIDLTERQVFVALGSGGQSNDPEIISLIPISKFNQNTNITLIKKEYEITKGTLDFIQYCKRIKVLNNQSRIVKVDPLENNEAINGKGVAKSNRGKVLLVLFFMIIACIITIFILKPFSKINSEELLRNNISLFYRDLSSNDMKKILPHFNNEVERWFSLNRPTLFQINQDIVNYSKKYPFKNINVLWDTFKYTKLVNGYYETEYMLDYNVKERVESRYKSYLLKIKAVWTEDMKLVNISEIIYKKK